MATPATEPTVFPPLQTETYGSQLFWLAVTFGVLYWAMSKLIVPRLTTIVEGRNARIAKDLEAAGKAKAQVDEAVAAYEAAMAEARANATATAQKARDEMAAKTDETRKSLEADLAKKLAKAEAAIARRRTEAMGEVKGIAMDAAAAIVAQLAGKTPPSDALEGAVDAALAQRQTR